MGSPHAESDSDYQLRLFLLLLTATVHHKVTGSQKVRIVRVGEGGGGRVKREREGE